MYFFFFFIFVLNSKQLLSYLMVPTNFGDKYWENKAFKSCYEKDLPKCSIEKKTPFALHMPHKVLQLQRSWSGSGIYHGNMMFRLCSWKGLKYLQ